MRSPLHHISSSGCKLMLVVRPLPVIKNGVQRCQIGRIRVEPRVDVLWFDWDDTAVVPGGCDFWWRFGSDRRKRP